MEVQRLILCMNSSGSLDSLQVSEESADIIKGPVCRLQSTLDSSSPAVAAKNRGSVWFVCSGLP